MEDKEAINKLCYNIHLEIQVSRVQFIWYINPLKLVATGFL